VVAIVFVYSRTRGGGGKRGGGAKDGDDLLFYGNERIFIGQFHCNRSSKANNYLIETQVKKKYSKIIRGTESLIY
jgi:hypothetical protein